MSETAERIRAELSLLPAEDRAELAHFLIRSLDPDGDADAETAWEAELARRANEIQSGQAVGEPAPGVFEELRRKSS